VNWIFGNYISYANKRDPETAKKYLGYCIAFNLLLLGFFEYWDFLAVSLADIGLDFLPVLHVSLPIGISFYTFQAMSYPIDIYRKDTLPQKSLLNFGTYVTMFPQLIAGPIVRYKDIARQLNKRIINLGHVSHGIERFVCGLCKKVLLANQAGYVYESIHALLPQNQSVLTSWIGVFCFAFQIYFDFSGYSDMALGLGEILGFRFLENFNYPYISTSITDFWRRWHMSLSYWFRDYVYIPLGGNRKGLARQIINIMIVWLLTGLWHGASWNFVLWGICYGIVLILEKIFLLKALEKSPSWLRHVYTMLVVLLLWVLFANTDLSAGLHEITMLFGNAPAFANRITLYYLRDNYLLLLVSAVACTPVAKSRLNPLKWKKFEMLKPVVILAGLFACTACIVNASYNPFLYFRF
ncbi:MAG: MBOAT family protein, partial [Solobacterium sp.]|nr:MBOAT family protein [Solobacterium sp.]